MKKAKTFFYFAAGAFLLAISWHLGARNAGAQAGAMVVGIQFQPPAGEHNLLILTDDGSVFSAVIKKGADGRAEVLSQATYGGNVWGGPTPVQRESWGQLKARYRERAPDGK